MFVPRLRVAHLVAALAAALALGIALGSERWGGLVPCALCLAERWPYRIALALALAGLVVPRVWSRLLLLVLVLTLLGSAATAAVHVGVEEGWWPSPLPQCQAPRIDPTLPLAERLARMPLHPSRACEDPTYLLPAVPISMAGLNLLLSLALAGLLAMFAWRTRRSDP